MRRVAEPITNPVRTRPPASPIRRNAQHLSKQQGVLRRRRHNADHTKTLPLTFDPTTTGRQPPNVPVADRARTTASNIGKHSGVHASQRSLRAGDVTSDRRADVVSDRRASVCHIPGHDSSTATSSRGGAPLGRSRPQLDRSLDERDCPARLSTVLLSRGSTRLVEPEGNPLVVATRDEPAEALLRGTGIIRLATQLPNL